MNLKRGEKSGRDFCVLYLSGESITTFGSLHFGGLLACGSFSRLRDYFSTFSPTASRGEQNKGCRVKWRSAWIRLPVEWMKNWFLARSWKKCCWRISISALKRFLKRRLLQFLLRLILLYNKRQKRPRQTPSNPLRRSQVWSQFHFFRFFYLQLCKFDIGHFPSPSSSTRSKGRKNVI